MNLKTFCDFYREKDEHYKESDDFVRRGYGQKARGYISNARNKGIERVLETAEPNQKWHLLNSYYEEKNDNKEARRCYGYLLCPELLLWIAEAAGFDVKEIKEECEKIIDSNVKYARNIAGRYIKKQIIWDMIESELKKQNRDL